MSASESPQQITTTGTPHIRVALVTGAAHGIGRAIALHLAADGLDVVLNDLATNTAQLDALVHEIEKLGRRAVAVTADVASEDAVRAMVESAVAALGRLDVMVANAGVGANGAQSVMEASVENWEKCWQVNIRGVLLCYKYAARQMVKQGDGGRIIGASSICGVRGYAGIGGYCISKAAVRSLTQTTALELREYNITVNAYAPGVIETNMTAHEADKDHSPGFTLKQFFKIPDFRTGQPSDVAAVVSFLASPGSQFVTGQTISVDDGVHFS